MIITFYALGAKNDPLIADAVEQYTKKIGFYYKCHWKLIAPPRVSASLSMQEVLKAEALVISEAIPSSHYLVLLDERGKMLDSPGVASLIDQVAHASGRQLAFLIGGAFGVSDSVRQRADFVWSFSKLVFPHQLMRVMLAEQVYRACTIQRNEKYHHV